MSYAPVCITTLNRYAHLKNCVESLSRCVGAQETELHIAVDFPNYRNQLDGYSRVLEYLPTIRGFKSVTVYKRERNFGPGANLKNLQMSVFLHHDRLITTEDDNEFSPSFLRYMNAALERYAGDQNVLGACGYLPPVQTDDLLGSNQCFLYDGVFPYGYGTWRNRVYDSQYGKVSNARLALDWRKMMRILRKKDFLFPMFFGMVKDNVVYGDVSNSTHMALDGKCAVCPPLSLVRNKGLDGSGLRSGSEDPLDLMHQRIVETDSFEPDFSAALSLDRQVAQRIDVQRRMGFRSKLIVFVRYWWWYALKMLFR